MTQLSRRFIPLFSLLLLSAFLFAGCDGSTGLNPENSSPTSDAATQAGGNQPTSAEGRFQCPSNPDKVVENQEALQTAMRESAPGTVVAIEGTIQLSESIKTPFKREGLTLTCATPGSGVELVEGNREVLNNLFSIRFPDFTLRDLKIDARQADGQENDTWARAAIFAGDNAVKEDTEVDERPTNADRVRIANNLFLLDADENRGRGGYAVRLIGPQDAVVTGNTIRNDGNASAGIFISPNGRAKEVNPSVDTIPRPHRAKVRNNTILTETTTSPHFFGGIVASAGEQIEIEGNTVQGPWKNGIVINDLDDGLVAGNVVTGPERQGLRFNRNPGDITRDAVVERNRIEKAGEAFRVRQACGNVFRGNALVKNNDGGVFEDNTGNNEYLGNPRRVTDNGSFDCTDDGVVDPNRIKGGPGR